MNIKDLVTVYTVGNPIEAEMAKNCLAGEGIPSFVMQELVLPAPRAYSERFASSWPGATFGRR